jgi:mono/diheme cytochrome c family protein
MSIRFLIAASLIVVAAACGGERAPDAAGSPPPSGGAPAAGEALTAFQLEHGIGPVTEVMTLEAPDHELAEAGKELFATKCSACHKLAERYVGPALHDVVERRTPTYVMNMILNPQEMYEKHPAAKQLLAEYLSFMPNQGLTRDEARAVLEYLRPEGQTVD